MSETSATVQSNYPTIKSEQSWLVEGIYVYIELIHFAVWQKLTQLCKATILQSKLIKKKADVS